MEKDEKSIAQVDQSLKDWVGSLGEDVPVDLHSPGGVKSEMGVGFYLMELREKKSPSNGSCPPLQFTLRYLVTVRAAEPERAHTLLGRLLFAAMERADFAVVLDPLPPSVWSAFGLAPQPSFLLDVPMRKSREQPAVKMVRHPLIVDSAPVGALRGIVVGSENIPLAGARVEIPAMRLVTTTDRKGAFQFTSLPAGRALQLRIHSKGQAFSTTAGGDRVGQDNPFVIRFPILEE